ncbi:MarR family transcriptional regulator [Saccharobesus litoralis]|uniref:MarR family transcriptional regulator n=2 Tax=Saccharobesus litoralis TaxID=2172099 RepID=A0A2S0VNP7_9ALTE|nr:MarR family transcriptional regulator [Saccharobesus litoralis]
MVESLSLNLVMISSRMNHLISEHLANTLTNKGFPAATSSTLNFLSALECDVNYGSEIARKLGVSRQMVAKTVKEMVRLGYLEQLDGVGKQKQIVFTELGEQLMASARQTLAELDDLLLNEPSINNLTNTINELRTVQKIVSELID